MNTRLQRVLFVCVGNACRSQIAEAFARTYGSDVMAPASAGLSPAPALARDAVRAMEEKGIEMRAHFPKSIRQLGKAEFDVVINMSGKDLPSRLGPEQVDWEVEDPMGQPFKRHQETRDLIERKVMELILDLRRRTQGPQFRSLHRPF